MQNKNQEGIADGTEVFFVLRTQHLVPAQKQTPESFYIKGLIEDGEFVPKSGILGNGELSTKGRYGWLELGSRAFFPMESDKKASTPFVKGYQTPQGFEPSTRDIYSEP